MHHCLHARPSHAVHWVSWQLLLRCRDWEKRCASCCFTRLRITGGCSSVYERVWQKAIKTLSTSSPAPPLHFHERVRVTLHPDWKRCHAWIVLTHPAHCHPLRCCCTLTSTCVLHSTLMVLSHPPRTDYATHPAHRHPLRRCPLRRPPPRRRQTAAAALQASWLAAPFGRAPAPPG